MKGCFNQFLKAIIIILDHIFPHIYVDLYSKHCLNNISIVMLSSSKRGSKD
jgi:hypothetical protein